MVVYEMHYVGMLQCLCHCTAVYSLSGTPIVHSDHSLPQNWFFFCFWTLYYCEYSNQ